MIAVPLLATPAQTFQIVLGAQDCRLTFYQRGQRLYSDLAVNAQPIWQGVVCQTLVDLKSYAWLPFQGALFFVDMEGWEDPRAEGLGTRWPLLYAAGHEDVPALQKRGIR